MDRARKFTERTSTVDPARAKPAWSSASARIPFAAAASIFSCASKAASWDQVESLAVTLSRSARRRRLGVLNSSACQAVAHDKDQC